MKEHNSFESLLQRFYANVSMFKSLSFSVFLKEDVHLIEDTLNTCGPSPSEGI